MGFKICSLSSGSSGNCIFVSSDTTQILVDAGVPASFALNCLEALGAKKQPLHILITHTHSDHISNLAKLSREFDSKVFIHYTAAPIKYKTVACTQFDTNEFMVGDIKVTPIPVPHDVPCMGYKLKSGGGTISILTDLGRVDKFTLDAVTGSDICYIESNHDVDMLKRCSYPYVLKQRILSNIGHLSNEQAARVCMHLYQTGTKQFILGHLSEKGNTQELALDTVNAALNSIDAKEGIDYFIETAPRHSMSGLYKIDLSSK